MPGKGGERSGSRERVLNGASKVRPSVSMPACLSVARSLMFALRYAGGPAAEALTPQLSITTSNPQPCSPR